VACVWASISQAGRRLPVPGVPGQVAGVAQPASLLPQRRASSWTCRETKKRLTLGSETFQLAASNSRLLLAIIMVAGKWWLLAAVCLCGRSSPPQANEKEWPCAVTAAWWVTVERASHVWQIVINSAYSTQSNWSWTWLLSKQNSLFEQPQESRPKTVLNLEPAFAGTGDNDNLQGVLGARGSWASGYRGRFIGGCLHFLEKGHSRGPLGAIRRRGLWTGSSHIQGRAQL
jgi:hypothetical protein